MNAAEVNVLLTKAAMIDPRMRRLDVEEAADRVVAWAELLADVTLDEALTAMREHYRDSTEALLPAHIVKHAGVEHDPWAHLPDNTEAVIARDKQRKLEAAGVTEEELEAHKHDRAWLEAKFGPLREVES